MMKDKLLLFLILCALIIRLLPFNFPNFTFEEARIASRAYMLAVSGKDELGRSFPLLFNSLQDYQLPAVSYITALGILIFGKNDYGARIPFIIISLVLMVLVYKIADLFIPRREFRLFCTLLTAFSPALIFLSKTPNETIVLIFDLVLLFYLLTREKLNFLMLSLTMIFTLITSKIAWWVLLPFIIFTLIFFQSNIQKKTKIKLILISLSLVLLSIALFLQVPQAKRSLLENDFSIFNDTSIKVASDRLRGQGLEAGWPNFLEKLLFNKSQLFLIGFLNWIQSLNPAFLFGRFDETGVYGFMSMAAFPKIAIIPFVMGILFAMRKGSNKLSLLLFYFLVLTFPLMFRYPGDSKIILATILPVIIFITAFGLLNLNRAFKILILMLLVIEVLINVINTAPEIKNANYSRPVWLGAIVKDSYNLSVQNNVAISDDLTPDIIPVLEWFSPLTPKGNFKDMKFAYKFRQNKEGNIRIIGADDNFYFCGLDKPTYVFASARDLAEIKRWLNVDVSRELRYTYADTLGKKEAYLFEPTICVK